MSVRHSVQGGGSPQVNITHDALDLTVQAPWPQISDMSPLLLVPDSLLVTSGAITGDLFKLVHLRTPPLVLTSGGHRSIFIWQVGGKHPTGMLSCLFYFCFKGNTCILDLFAVIIENFLCNLLLRTTW